MAVKSVVRITTKLCAVTLGLWHASFLNVRMLKDKIYSRKTLVIHINAATQLMHVEPLLRELVSRESGRQLSLFMLTSAADIASMKPLLAEVAPRMSFGATQSARFLIFCDFLLTVDQGMVFPYVGCKTRACCFHGQPSKGNTYQYFSFKQINALFFYGPLMRDHYLRAKKEHPGWPDVPYYEVGQPLSDHRINHRLDKRDARRALGLSADTFTVLYAPSFEYCASLATHGHEIIESLLSVGVNLIIKPHPAFYNTSRFADDFNRSSPNASEWRERVEVYDSKPNCVFSLCNSLDATVMLSAADIMLTDFSGIAFDGILLDLGMIYWDCPLLYSEYLPRRYSINGDEAKTDLACNVGRDAGIVVNDVHELAAAIALYRDKPDHKAAARERIRAQLLFNPGRGSESMASTIEELLGV